VSIVLWRRRQEPIDGDHDLRFEHPERFASAITALLVRLRH